MKTIIGINGACGRMGQRLVALAHEGRETKVGAALDAVGHPLVGRDAGEVAGIGPIGLLIDSDVPVQHRLDALIDFSSPEGTQAALKLSLERKIPLVVATTGHTAEQKQEILAAAHHVAILFSPNMSLVVNVLFHLTREAGRLLNGKDFDVEIVERHHRFKKDSPSGTAVHFARIVQETMGQKETRHGREGLVGERPREEIGIHAVRAGDNIGEHTIIFSALGETMELVHKGYSRDSYARGALLAAQFLAGRPAGSYSMNDVLGIG